MEDIAGEPDAQLTPKSSQLDNNDDANKKLNGYCKDCAGEATAKDGHQALVCLRSILNLYEPDKHWQPLKKIYFNEDKRNNVSEYQRGVKVASRESQRKRG